MHIKEKWVVFSCYFLQFEKYANILRPEPVISKESRSSKQPELYSTLRNISILDNMGINVCREDKISGRKVAVFNNMGNNSLSYNMNSNLFDMRRAILAISAIL